MFKLAPFSLSLNYNVQIISGRILIFLASHEITSLLTSGDAPNKISLVVLQEGLSEQCSEVMMETINRATVCTYQVAATQYCETQVQSKCVEWLERRLTSETSITLLKDIR